MAGIDELRVATRLRLTDPSLHAFPRKRGSADSTLDRGPHGARQPEHVEVAKTRGPQLARRLVISIGLPAIALVATFPILRSFTTVYNEPQDRVAALTFALVCTAVPGAALAMLVKDGVAFIVGVALSVVAGIVVAMQIATTDDAQAGLAILGLPGLIGIALAIGLLVDRWRKSE